MSILNNTLRYGRFTSSNIYKLMGTPAPRKTYIYEKSLEIKLGRSLDIEQYSRAMDWGNFCEIRVHNLLGTDYVSCGKITIAHPTQGNLWSGSPDQRNDRLKKGAEIKCYHPKNFAESVDAFTEAFAITDYEQLKKDCPKELWQGISNAILLDVEEFEWIFYMPYARELPELAKMADEWDGEAPWRYRFISEAVSQGNINELPYLPDVGFYTNLNIFKFKIKEFDKKLLTDEVERAGKELELLIKKT